jgi:hypothetical protein
MRAAAQRPSRAPFLAAALLLLLLALCALAAGGQAGVGASIGAAGKPAAALALVVLTAAGIVGLVVVALVLRALGLIGRPPDERIPWHPVPGGPLARLIAIAAPLLVVLAVVAVFIGLAHVGGHKANSGTKPGGEAPSTTTTAARANEPPADATGGFDTSAKIEVAIGAALALVAVGVALRRLRGDRPVQAVQAKTAEEGSLQAAAARALRASSEFQDPRAAVIAAYAEMEGELAERGFARRPSEAPFEYVGRAGGEFRTPLERLAQLFELARFSRREVSDGARTEAETLLTRLRDER